MPVARSCIEQFYKDRHIVATAPW